MNKPKVSVIIPVYNGEKYLRDCLDSVLNQTYENLEIIIINDGSKDQSEDICLQYFQKDKRIVYKSKKNEGVSVARNHALDLATGEFILFMDCDDLLSLNAISFLLTTAQEHHVDSVAFNYCQFRGEFKRFIPFSLHDKHIFCREILIEQLYNYHTSNIDLGLAFRAVWGKLLSASVIKKANIRFPEGMSLSEDACFMFNYVMACDKIYVVDEPLYHYRLNDNSATQSHKSNLVSIELQEYAFIQKNKNRININWDAVLSKYWMTLCFNILVNNFKKNNVKDSTVFFDTWNELKSMQLAPQIRIQKNVKDSIWNLCLHFKLYFFQTVFLFLLYKKKSLKK
ncbi:glycosyltransferase family 2 protein [Hallerella porci]|uniref:Glycosyl transferase family 2 n=1 Tax=Hallerella porci TaxID=1945871 RepID=A0ABX5LIJ6_9BACT|nr:glycosyltransferase family 2 protein [Hallerella porci]PWK92651.1 glycosyl transferase family 2 [Hallerella porci]